MNKVKSKRLKKLKLKSQTQRDNLMEIRGFKIKTSSAHDESVTNGIAKKQRLYVKKVWIDKKPKEKEFSEWRKPSIRFEPPKKRYE